LRFSFPKFKALKCSLNLTTNTTSQNSNTLLRSELKGMSGGLKLIAYRRPSGRTTLQCTHRWQTHTPYTYLYLQQNNENTYKIQLIINNTKKLIKCYSHCNIYILTL
jgi:hypothetical protein